MLLGRRGDFLLSEDFFLIVFGGIAETAIVGLITEAKQEHQATEPLICLGLVVLAGMPGETPSVGRSRTVVINSAIDYLKNGVI